MNNFNRYCLYMLRYRWRLTIGITCAVLSATVLSSGLVIALPVIHILLLKGGSKAITAGAAGVAGAAGGAAKSAAAAALPTFRQAMADLNTSKFHNLVPASWINHMPDDMVQGFILLMGVFMLVTVVGSITRAIHGYLTMRISTTTTNDIRLMAFSHLLRIPLMSASTEMVAERASKMMRDTDRLGRGFTALTSKSLGYLLKGLCMISVAFYFDWRLALAALLCIPLLVIVSRLFGKYIRRASKRCLMASGTMLGVITQSFSGLRVVKVHTAERVEVGRLRIANTHYLNMDRPLRMGKAVAAPTIETLATFCFILIAIWGAWRIFHNSTTPAEVGTALIALLLGLQTLRPLTYVLNEVHEASAAADRIAEVMKMPLERPERTQAKLPAIPPVTGRITFENIVFQYPTAERPALNGVNLQIEPGTTTAFVGPNGCGKTTLLGLVPRLYDPTSGVVRIDGHDLRRVSLHSIRRQIGVVTQETILFYDTIKHNLAYGSGTASEEQIRAAARSARAEGFILGKPQGYDTLVGDQGLTLSGGERQRIAIARAILRNPKVLILDEATSMIDADSEAQITALLEQFCKGRTSLIIAHRLSTVVNADRIVVMNFGRIEDIGKHEELLERCILYQQLCRTQLVSEEVAGSTGAHEAGSPGTALMGGVPPGPSSPVVTPQQQAALRSKSLASAALSDLDSDELENEFS